MVMEFKEGGAFDFASIFERLKERLRQAVDVARESGVDEGGVMANNIVHLEDLPAYEDRRDGAVESDGRARADAGAGGPTTAAPQPTGPQHTSPLASPQTQNFQPPDEPPPGYEEAQRDSVVEELERQARRMSGD